MNNNRSMYICQLSAVVTHTELSSVVQPLALHTIAALDVLVLKVKYSY